MKFTILIKMLFMLLSKKRITAKEVAERFEISTRSVYRYVDELTLANVPVITERGNGGGISISETFKLHTAYLTREEFRVLTEILNGVSAGLNGDKVISGIIEKLFSCKKSEDLTFLGSSSLIIDGSGWNDYGQHNEKIAHITKAINDCTALKISYHDRNGETSVREIEPHALVLKNGVWYVYAYCLKRKGFRLFKVGRIEYLNPTNSFLRKDFDAATLPFEKWFGSIEKEEIELIVDKRIRSDVEEWLGVENVCVTPSGTIKAICRLPYDKSLISEISKFGNAIKVVRPQKLKDDILSNAEEIIKLYSKQ